MKKKILTGLVALGLLSGQAMAAVSVTAHYPNSSPPVTFDTYDFFNGVLALDYSAATVGTTVTGAFQTAVANHVLGGSLVGSPASDGYELTLVGNFTATIFDTSNGFVAFNNLNGSFDLYWDNNSQTAYDYTGTGTGFNDGTHILKGQITTGGGSTGTFNSNVRGIGFSYIVSDITASSSVFSPTLPTAGETNFALGSFLLPPGATGAGTLDSTSSSTVKVTGTDGNLVFTTAVPLPAAALLLGPVLLAGIGWQSRQRISKLSA